MRRFLINFRQLGKPYCMNYGRAEKNSMEKSEPFSFILIEEKFPLKKNFKGGEISE